MEDVARAEILEDWKRWREWRSCRKWEREHHARSWRSQERFLMSMEEMAELKKKRACLGMGISCLLGRFQDHE